MATHSLIVEYAPNATMRLPGTKPLLRRLAKKLLRENRDMRTLLRLFVKVCNAKEPFVEMHYDADTMRRIRRYTRRKT